MKKYQIVLVMYTRGNMMRSAAHKWDIESGLPTHNDCVYAQQESSLVKKYPTVLQALADGWHLLAPPNGEGHYYSWWLTMSVEPL